MTSVVGQVSIKTATSNWQAAKANAALPGGASIRTGQRSKAAIRYTSGTVARLGANTVLRIKSEDASNVKLVKGKTYVNKQKDGKTMKVKTPNAVATVLGTELFVSHNETTGTSHVTTLNGSVEVMTDQGEKAMVESGFWVEIEQGKPLEVPTKFDWNQLKKKERFLLDPNFVPSDDESWADSEDWH